MALLACSIESTSQQRRTGYTPFMYETMPHVGLVAQEGFGRAVKVRRSMKKSECYGSPDAARKRVNE